MVIEAPTSSRRVGSSVGGASTGFGSLTNRSAVPNGSGRVGRADGGGTRARLSPCFVDLVSNTFAHTAQVPV
jgi:hypothetical protein